MRCEICLRSSGPMLFLPRRRGMASAGCEWRASSTAIPVFTQFPTQVANHLSQIHCGLRISGPDLRTGATLLSSAAWPAPFPPMALAGIRPTPSLALRAIAAPKQRRAPGDTSLTPWDKDITVSAFLNEIRCGHSPHSDAVSHSLTCCDPQQALDDPRHREVQRAH